MGSIANSMFLISQRDGLISFRFDRFLSINLLHVSKLLKTTYSNSLLTFRKLSQKHISDYIRNWSMQLRIIMYMLKQNAVIYICNQASLSVD